MTESWEFDNYNPCQEENTKVEVSDSRDGPILKLIRNNEIELQIETDIDQWGTWITFVIRDEDGTMRNLFTIAQESGTRSFIDALINGLTLIKPVWPRQLCVVFVARRLDFEQLADAGFADRVDEIAVPTVDRIGIRFVP